VGLAAEDLLIGVVDRQPVDGLYGFHDDLAAGDWLTAERAVQHHVLGEQTTEGVYVRAAVDAVDEGFPRCRGAGRTWSWLLLAVRETWPVHLGCQPAEK
jgi:hypothetical protein